MQHASEETLDRTYYSQKERESMDEEDFAGPHRSYPIKTQEDVHNAAKLIGHADDPETVKAKIKSIAKRKGFSLPESWQDEEEEETSQGEEKRATNSHQATEHDSFEGSHDHIHQHLDGYSHSHPHDHVQDNLHDHTHGHQRSENTSTHDEYKGTHTHTHTHSDGYTHEHQHDHENDMNHDHGHAHVHHRSASLSTSEIRQQTMYLPFTRIDSKKREVIGQATAEIPDSYGTIFGFYPEAWDRWRGNIREQHDPKKAVGKRIEHFPKKESKSVDLHVRVSRGAQDTWMKVEDDVLTGFSLSVIPDPEFGNDTRKWPKKLYEGKEYPYLPRYSIAEVSLVDNPACPGCNIAIVRADGATTDILDALDGEEEEDKDKENQKEEHLRPVKRNKASIHHDAIGHTLHAAKAQMQGCGCPICLEVMKFLDPDDDGDIDLGGYDDPDNDAFMPRSKDADIDALVSASLERSLSPIFSRFQKIAGMFAKWQDFSTFERSLTTIEKRIEDLSNFDDIRAELSAVKDRVEKIADQPMPGGPVHHTNASPAEKRTPLEPPNAYATQSYGSVYDAIAALSKSGQLNTEEKQTDALAAALTAQRWGRR